MLDAHRYYTADMTMYTVNNTARFNGGIEVKKRLAELIEKKPKDTRTAEDIINNIKSKLNGEYNESI